MEKYYTYISVNKKTIKITESQSEHDDRMKRLRAAQKAQMIEEKNKKDGWNGSTTLICRGCGAHIPYNKYVRSGDWYCKHCNYAPKTYKNGPGV